jgi:glycosyltransferase involved in cell wall biosynthesis
MSLDLAILGQDPRFGGGFFSFASTFWRAAAELGRDSHLLYLSRVARAGAPVVEEHSPFIGTAFPSPLRELDGVSQLLGARRMTAPARDARSLWVVAASAPYGAAATRARRPYACWLATGLESEWASRRSELSPSRRAALALNAPLLRKLERDVIAGARLVFTISPSSRDEVAAISDRADIDWLPIPVDTERLQPAGDDEWVAGLDEPTLVFVGRGADPRKNLRLLLEALPLIRRRIPGATLRLVGEPPGVQLPEGAVAVGRIDDVATELRRASLFVLPSLQEGFGIVVAEAFACGLPAIVTPSGGPEALVHESRGGVVLPGFEAEALADAVVDVLADREELIRMRRSARTYVEREHAPARLRQRLADAFVVLDG